MSLKSRLSVAFSLILCSIALNSCLVSTYPTHIIKL